MHEYVKHIARTKMGLEHKSICGVNLGIEWHFVGLDHALENSINEGRLVPCQDCLRTAFEIMEMEDDTNKDHR